MSKRINETLDFGSAARLINLPAPASASEPARLSDLQSAQAAITWETPVRVVGIANLNVAAPGANIDGVALTAGDRVLLTGQTDAHENGWWVWNGAAVAMTRAADSAAEGSIFPVDEGGNAGTIWMLTTQNPVPGTTTLTFSQIGRLMVAGTGIVVAGNTVGLATPVAVANGGTAAGDAATARTNLGAVGRYEQDFGDGAASSFNIDHNLGHTYVQARVYLKSTGAEEDCLVTCVSTSRISLSSEAWIATPPAANTYRVVVQA